MNAIIIVLCVLLLLAYLGEISSERTKIPTVILLLFIGWLSRQGTVLLNISIPDLNPVLPFLGTIGLILIVLEGAFDLKISREKINVVKKTFFMALLPMIFLSFLFAWVFSWYAEVSFHSALINAIPLSVVSSSIAIPSARNISAKNREFVIYESSLSDIIGVLFFNYVLINEMFSLGSIGLFLLQVILITLISLFSVMGLSFLLGRIRNHITYTPIILLVILVYSVAKAFDLSGLVFILVLGLFLGNLSQIRHFYLVEKLLETVDSERLSREVTKFNSITIEATFVVRSLFFLLFGFLMETNEFFDLVTLPWAFGIVTVIFASRWLFLKLMRLPVTPLLFFSPRGLITILLFMSVTPDLNIFFVNNSLLVQIIIISVIVMAAGLMRYGRE